MTERAAGHPSRPLRAALVLGLVLLALVATDFLRARHRFLWFDELCTAAVVSRGTVAGVREALARGVDTMPPPFYLVEFASVSAFSDPHLGYRVPSILAALVVPACLYAFARPRLGTAGALVAALVPLAGGRFRFYAIESRPYMLVAACIALALLAWRRLYRPAGLVAAGALLMAATSLHYYAVLALAPIGLAEIARSARTRTVRLRAWAALVAALLPLLLFWPLLAQVKALSGPHYWAQASLALVPGTYDALLGLDHGIGAAVAAVLAAGLLVPVRARVREDASAPGLPLEERIVALGYLGLPLVGYAVARLTAGGMTARYVFPTVLGVALAAGHLATRLAARHGRAIATAALAALAARATLHEGRYLRDVLRLPAARTGAYPELERLRTLVARAGAPALPVVVSSGIDYVPIAWYAHARPETPATLALIDEEAALASAGSDSVERTLRGLEGSLPLRLEAFPSFAARTAEFLVYAQDDDRFDWWPGRLRAMGWLVDPAASGDGRTLFRVTRPARPGATGAEPGRDAP